MHRNVWREATAEWHPSANSLVVWTGLENAEVGTFWPLVLLVCFGLFYFLPCFLHVRKAPCPWAVPSPVDRLLLFNPVLQSSAEEALWREFLYPEGPVAFGTLPRASNVVAHEWNPKAFWVEQLLAYLNRLVFLSLTAPFLDPWICAQNPYICVALKISFLVSWLTY